jgi:hypothetical protein
MGVRLKVTSFSFSAVHSHWCLVRLLRRFPTHIDADAVATALARSVTKAACETEAAYFKREGADTFERPYGWGWLLKLSEECFLASEESLDPSSACAAYHSTFKDLYRNLAPIAHVIRDGWLGYLPKLTFAVRSGVHSNTAFALALSYDFARTVEDDQLRDAISQCAMRLYGSDVGYNTRFEPSGEDFLSPGLCEMELMLRVLATPAEFRKWARDLMPSLLSEDQEEAEEPILRIPTVSDRSDARICHLDGLLLSKAWNLRSSSGPPTLPPSASLRLPPPPSPAPPPSPPPLPLARQHGPAS